MTHLAIFHERYIKSLSNPLSQQPRGVHVCLVSATEERKEESDIGAETAGAAHAAEGRSVSDTHPSRNLSMQRRASGGAGCLSCL